MERLVAAAAELMNRFNGSAYVGFVRNAIRANVTEQGGREALARLHELTAPPYR